MKTVKAFTLIELLIVMAIVGVLLTLSLSAIVGLRESSRLNRILDDFYTESKSNLSNARNNVYRDTELASISSNVQATCANIATSSFLPEARGYYFANGEYKNMKCLHTQYAVTSNFCCVEETDYDAVLNLDTNNIVFNSNCTGVLFDYSTGDILTTSSTTMSTLLADSSNDCSVEVRHKTLGFNKTILYKVNENTIEVQP